MKMRSVELKELAARTRCRLNGEEAWAARSQLPYTTNLRVSLSESQAVLMR